MNGISNVPADSIRAIFIPDHGRSILRIPLDTRRSQIESIPWIQQAVIRRELPNTVVVDVRERVPVAWLRQPGGLSLVDADGAILDRPQQGEFHFPVVTGLSADIAQQDRGQRLHLMQDFLQQIDLARAGSSDRVSEIDLSDAADVRATFARLSDLDPAAATDPRQTGAVVVEFGDRGFQDKFRLLLENLEQWRATVGKIEAVDLRFGREAVVNPQTAAPPVAAAQPAVAAPSAPAAVQPASAQKP